MTIIFVECKNTTNKFYNFSFLKMIDFVLLSKYKITFEAEFYAIFPLIIIYRLLF